MDAYCIPDFKTVCNKLLKNNSYSHVFQEIIKVFHERSVEDCIFGTCLFQKDQLFYIKKDIGGRSGFRLYYIVLKDSKKIYFGFIHPKTGSDGSSNTTTEFRSSLPSEILAAIDEKKLLKVTITNKRVLFTEME